MQSLPPVIVTLAQQAARAWPMIDVPVADFASHLLTLAPAAERDAWARAIHADDLLLVYGCSRGSSAAYQAFDAHCLRRIPAFLRSKNATLSEAESDEVLQLLREKLFAAKPDTLATYSGRGDVRLWVGTIAFRLLQNLHRSNGKFIWVEPNDPVFDALAEGVTPEVQYGKEQARAALKAALQVVYRRLKPLDRSLLRLHYLRQATLKHIADIHQIAISTVHARLQRLYRQLREGVLRELEQQGHPCEQLESLIAAGRSLFAAHLASLLRSPDDEEADDDNLDDEDRDNDISDDAAAKVMRARCIVCS